LYVDDIVLLSDSPEDLQSMLDFCQEYADDHSFQFSFQKSQVVVFGDDVDYPHEWKFMGKTMTQSSYYKYLGMIFRRCLGRFSSVPPGAVARRKYVGMKFIDDRSHCRQLRLDGSLPSLCNKCCQCQKSTLADDGLTALKDVVLCDHCDAETHLGCSGLSSIPRGDFFCHKCHELDLLVVRKFDDCENQERIVQSIRWVSSKKRSVRGCKMPSYAVAVTSRIDQDDKQIAEYPCARLDRLIDRYSAYHGVKQKQMFTTDDPWEGVRDDIESSLLKLQHQVVLMGCHCKGLPFGMAKMVTQTMLLSTALKNSEVWQMGKESTTIQSRINTIYRKMLGVPQSTNTVALYNEMGLINQTFRAQVSSLKFRNHILNIPDNRLVKQLYMALRSETGGINGNIRTLNGVLSFMDPFAESVGWSSPKMRCDVKKDAHELLCSLQRKLFNSAKVKSLSVRALSVWTSSDRTAPYLLRKAFSSSSLTEGRRLKAKLRLGSHELRCHVNDDGRVIKSTKNELCQCCSVPQAVRETVYHSLGDCDAYVKSRKECFSFIESKVPKFARLSKDKKVDFLLSDNNPASVDASIYRFLYTLFLERAKLVEPTGPGKETLVS
jgi:hypothetical protein